MNVHKTFRRCSGRVLNVLCTFNRSSRPEVFYKKVFLKISQNSQESTSARVSFLIKLQAKGCNFIKKETLVQLFSCEFCEIFKNTFFYRTPLVAASNSSYILSPGSRNQGTGKHFNGLSVYDLQINILLNVFFRSSRPEVNMKISTDFQICISAKHVNV